MSRRVAFLVSAEQVEEGRPHPRPEREVGQERLEGVADLGAAEPIGDPREARRPAARDWRGRRAWSRASALSICRSRLTSQSGAVPAGCSWADIVTDRSPRARGSVLIVDAARHGSPRTRRPALQASIAPAGSDRAADHLRTSQPNLVNARSTFRGVKVQKITPS